MAFPNIISAILAQVLGPIPRSVLLVLLLASSQKTTASPQTPQVRHTKLSLQCNFNRGDYFGVAVIPLCSGSYARHSSVGYLPRDVASLRVRHERLTRLDFHQLDCSLVGCSGVPIPISVHNINLCEIQILLAYLSVNIRDCTAIYLDVF